MRYFDSKEELLIFNKVTNPDMGERFNLLKDVKDLYTRFERVTSLEACEAVNDWIATVLPDRSERFEFKIVDDSSFRNEKTHVTIKCRIKGSNNWITLLPLPYMDEIGKLHFFDGSVKSFVNRLSSADDMSYDEEHKTLSIVSAKRMIKIMADGKTSDITIQGKYQKKLDLSSLITFKSKLEGDRIKMYEVISNPSLLVNMSKPSRAAMIPLSQVMSADESELISCLSEPDYNISSVRNSINASVVIDRALGMTLSRDVGGYHAGDYITATVISSLKKQKINALYVKFITPAPDKKMVAGMRGEPLVFTVIPAGTENCTFLMDRLPQYSDYSVFPHDVMLAAGGNDATGIIDLHLSNATEEVLQFLSNMGFTGVQLKSGDNVYNWPFEVEVVSNNTYRYRDVYSLAECESMGVDENDWFGTTARANTDYLTSEDLLAIYSTLGFMRTYGVNPFMDRDVDFLKKVETADVALASELRKAIRRHCNQYKDNIINYIRGNNSNNSNEIFQGLKNWFKSQLVSSKLIDTPDTTNMLAELSQATHITSILKEAPEVVRQISTPYYGRLCLYETPEGKKLGLVNNKAIGCQIKDGNMLVPVRKVFRVGDEVRIGDEITDLSVTEEARVRVSDVLSLTPGSKEGYYKNTRVIAKVPNPEPTGERTVYANIYAGDLDYVYAHTEEHLSMATNMIPFACSDDAVRVSFGTKMIKSAIYLLDPDIPRVQTTMYRKVFDSTNAYLIRAEADGEVVEIRPDMLVVQYDGYSDETEYRIKEFKVTKDAVIFMRYKVHEGGRVKKGQILVDCSATTNGYYCPGKSELIAYLPTGYNYEDALHVSERATIDYISIGSSSIEKSGNESSIVTKDGIYKYFSQGDIIDKITTPVAGGDLQTNPVRITHHGGILYNISVISKNKKKTYSFDILGFNRLGLGDKMSGLHGNKGVVSLVSNNSETPMLANGAVIRIIPNPHGLPSRMNCGQIMEGHLGLVAEVLNLRIVSDPFNGATVEEVREMMSLAYDLANCGQESECRAICARYNLEKELVDHIEKNMKHIMYWAGTFDKNGDARLWNPVTCKWYESKVTIGVSTFLKMKQEAEEKISYRGGIAEEEYKITTSQPPKGSGSGSQKMGDMELASPLAYALPNYIHEMWNEKSDNEGARTNMELAAIGSPLRVPDRYLYPRATYNLIYKLQAMGLHLMDTDNRLPDTSAEASAEHFVYDVNGILKSNTDGVEEEAEDPYDALF